MNIDKNIFCYYNEIILNIFRAVAFTIVVLKVAARLAAVTLPKRYLRFLTSGGTVNCFRRHFGVGMALCHATLMSQTSANYPTSIKVAQKLP